MSLTQIFGESPLEKKLTMDKPVESRLDTTDSKLVGKPLSRIEGHLKVAGKATYTAEHQFDDLCHGVMVGATIGKGKVKKVHKDSALQVAGVIGVFHDPLFLRNPQQGGVKMAPVQGASEVFYHGQPIALVVAETLEAAQEGAKALQIDYENDEKHGHFDFNKQKKHTQFIDWVTDKSDDIGKPEKTLKQAEVKVDVTYTTPSQSNMPMEPHSSLAHWFEGKLTLHTSNQMLASSKVQLAKALDIPEDDVRLLSPYVGGGFGSKLGISPESVMAAIAAKDLKRPVLVNMTRPQVMETTVRRTNTEQRVALGADKDGKIHTIIHNSIVTNLPSETFFEPVAVSTHFLYGGDNRQIKYEMARMNFTLTGSMRAPGEAVGQLALECAMDELAHALKLCPIELRKRNEPSEDPSKKIPYSTRKLLACMEQGAKAFGWDERPQTPASRLDGDWLIGYGMACAARSNELKPSQARVSLLPSDKPLGVLARIETDMTDIGTGSYTIFAQVVADMLGLPIDHVEVKLGDTDLPPAAGSGGSWGASSAGSSIYLACEALREKIAQSVGLHADSIGFKQGTLYRQFEHDPSLAEKIGEKINHTLTDTLDKLAEKTGLNSEVSVDNHDNVLDWEQVDTQLPLSSFLQQYAPHGLVANGEIEPGKTKKEYRHAGYGAQFAEVGVHRVTGEIRVRRMLGTFAAGRILNEKTARSQCFGGMVFGIGAALMEQIHHDKRDGRLCNHDLAEYQVCVNADVPDLEVIMLPETDPYANPLHSKGIGELALSGAGAAIANAIFNATGVRVRDYPITLDKLLYQLPLL
ncbi:xanthine dehydrogenase [Moraxella osloensis]|nr:xanthine dehydrogenase [Moraxella osloensis]